MTNEQKNELKQELREKTFGYILAALGLVAGLAWSDAIKALIEKIYPTEGAGIIVKFIYAIIITTLIIVVSSYLLKLGRKENSK